MAVLYITEYAYMAQTGSINQPMQFPLPAPQNPPIAEQHVAIGGSTAQSSAFNDNTAFVMVNTDEACSLAWGADPTAVTTAQRMGANETRFYGVPIGQKFKVAVIANS